ncbi:MAG: UDP-N-acetylmuramate dehydrogenase [Actinomycetales bacterium]|uniref:UDP-N-acetylenolpyruvoylglucosamine reductase n=1 Tax=Candidatus Phosphoribacter hodrii TaxID=2953743 RepID=A0A935M421_9MICO|nr:UDP-N-acetylmuramate dehydrogenase [Candidatus Phosphoribacter hodrii]MBK7273655.1 UDP-N-acetylmuramate dehydrogenase [Candidatus Phosphoribacter hodrii]MBL0002477.1 UDP-N-acetylmuramate dehydrogenase [Candidatus Phosphoribacter hodrii]HRC64409.1 UDP-N-acetylmuramate dehydrogenase [Dermatophilaceae bacterium]
MQEAFAAPLAALTTMRVGGPADRLVTAESIDDIVDAVREVDDADEPLLLLSGGSNLVVADDGFRGTVLRIASRGVRVESLDRCSGATVRVAAGEPWDDLVVRAVTEGWSGIEALSGIPGCVGSTPVQNVGAYGQEVADTIAQVRVWDRDREAVRTLTASECGFAYRDSVFKHRGARLVVLDVVFQLRLADLSAPVGYADLAAALEVAEGERVPLADAREAVLAQRRRRGMVLDAADHDTWSCGSFFTNPVLSESDYQTLVDRVADRLGPAGPAVPRWSAPGGVKTSAAWLIERAGFGKGFGMPGPAALSTKHTLAVTNRGSATAAEIVALARTVRDGVQDAFGVALVNEPVLVGLSL